MKTCRITLELFDGVEMDFINDIYESIHLWGFIKSKSIATHKLRLYLLSTIKNTKEEDEVQKMEEDIVTNSEDEVKKVI